VSEITNLGEALAAGLVLGALFFGGLWWTTQKGIASDQPALWFVGSLMARTSLMLAGLYYVSGDDWHRTCACLVGFITARMILLRLSLLPSFSQEAKRES
jgi:F1F0 ATPase subunit 2